MKNELEAININALAFDNFGNGMSGNGISGNGISGNGMSGNGSSCRDVISDFLEDEIKDIQRDL